MPFVRSLYSSTRIIEGISITRVGRIGLPKYFITQHSIHRGTRAYLYWDKRNSAIAIDFTNDDDPTAWPIIFTQAYGAFINANRFFRFNKLAPDQHIGRYTYTKMSGEQANMPYVPSDVFVVDLSSPKIVEHSKRATAAPRSEQNDEWRGSDGYD